jgi:hypothetical protein
MRRLLLACLVASACGKGSTSERSSAERGSSAPGTSKATTPEPVPSWASRLPDGAVEFARQRKRVYPGIESDVVWVAVRQDGVGLMPWIQENGKILDDTVVTIQGPHDPEVPQEGLPAWAQSVIMFAPKQNGERCAPCYDMVGKKVAEPISGCDC